MPATCWTRSPPGLGSCSGRPLSGWGRGARSGTNLALCNQETREALYRALVEGGYKIRPIGAGAEYREISQVFVH